MPSVTGTYGSTTDLPLNAFTNPGDVFKDWSTTPSGSGTTFTNGELVKLLRGL
jgi:hypothetical protein